MLDGITSVPTVLNGQPTIRGMRLSVRRGLEALAIYPNWDDLRREYPELEPEDIRQALAFAAELDAGAMVTVTDRAVRVRRLPLRATPGS